MKIRIAILTVAMLATAACNNSNDSAPPPQALLAAQPVDQLASATPSADSHPTPLPPDVELPPAPPAQPSSTQPGSLDDPIATFNGNSITYREILPIVLSGDGFNTMLLLFERDFARQQAQRDKIDVTPADIANEMKITMDDLKRNTTEMAGNGQPANSGGNALDLTPDQLDQLLDKELEQKHISRPEFDVYIETNAILRKIAEPQVQAHMTDDALHAEFNAEYGERVDVECIVAHNLVELGKAQAAIKNGESFESVARRLSIDRMSGEQGGKLEPFTLKDNAYPPLFRTAAFSLKVDEISDPVEIPQDVRGMADGFYLIKLISRIPPQHAKYDDYKDSVKQDTYRDMMATAMKAQQKQLQQLAVQLLKVVDPTLKKQWDEQVNPPAPKSADEIRKEMDSQHAPATMPVSPAPVPVPIPPASATMPATMPAAP